MQVRLLFPEEVLNQSIKIVKQTAIRETIEEVGIESVQFEIIGELSPLYVMVSNFTVHAFIGWSQSMPSFKINKSEVDALFVIPVEKLKNSTKHYQEVETHLGIKEFPGYRVNEIFIWGATAMILTEFIEIYKKVIG